jgi:hypothetical protein
MERVSITIESFRIRAGNRRVARAGRALLTQSGTFSNEARFLVQDLRMEAKHVPGLLVAIALAAHLVQVCVL